jgi:hypothetical protein
MLKFPLDHFDFTKIATTINKKVFFLEAHNLVPKGV